MNCLVKFVIDKTENLSFESRMNVCKEYGEEIAQYIKWEENELRNIIKNSPELIRYVYSKLKGKNDLIRLWVDNITDPQEGERAMIIIERFGDRKILEEVCVKFPKTQQFCEYINRFSYSELPAGLYELFKSQVPEDGATSYSAGTIMYMSKLYDSIVENYEFEEFSKIVLELNRATLDNFFNTYLHPRSSKGFHYISDEVKAGDKRAIQFVLDLIESKKFGKMKDVLVKFLLSNDYHDIPSHYYTRKVLTDFSKDIGSKITELDLSHLSAKDFSKVIGHYRYYRNINMLSTAQLKFKRKSDKAKRSSLVEVQI